MAVARGGAVNVQTLLERWKAITGAVLGTAGVLALGAGWIDRQHEDMEVRIRAEAELQAERILVGLNLTRCEIREIPPVDCDPYEGIEP